MPATVGPWPAFPAIPSIAARDHYREVLKLYPTDPETWGATSAAFDKTLGSTRGGKPGAIAQSR